MGGDIFVESKLGEGSAFTVEIAATAVSSPAEPITPSSHHSYENVIGLLPGQDDIRLLVVDDNEASRFALEELLLGAGFAVHTAANGEEAITEWEAWRPQLIWMDKRMPALDGCEAVRRIKSAPGGQETIIIALTGSISGDSETICETVDCDDFVSKPFQMAELFKKMAQHLGVQYAYQERVEVQAASSEMQLTREDLLLFSEQWRMALHDIILQGRAERVLAMIAEIRSAQPEIAAALIMLVEDFRFDELATLTEFM
jgi:CheY-like chemotaxis protein